MRKARPETDPYEDLMGTLNGTPAPAPDPPGEDPPPRPAAPANKRPAALSATQKGNGANGRGPARDVAVVTAPPASEPPAKIGRPLGKRSDPDMMQLSAYVPFRDHARMKQAVNGLPRKTDPATGRLRLTEISDVMSGLIHLFLAGEVVAEVVDGQVVVRVAERGDD